MSEQVLVIIGSKSDHNVMQDCVKTLQEFGVEVQYQVASAHRTPETVTSLASSARDNGFKIIIAGAGGAAHLAGVIAAHTSLPVIGVPMPSANLNGVDSLLSIVQMPRGIPVATVAIGGAKNAALLAIQILALSNSEMAKQFDNFRKQQTEQSLNVTLDFN